EHLHRFIEVNQAWKVLSNKETNSKRGLPDFSIRIVLCDIYMFLLRLNEAGELNQSWPIDERVSLDDMTSDDDNEVYAYGCCCGGEFSIGREAEDDWSRCCSLNPEELFDVKESLGCSLKSVLF
uniref:Uncharacterized protein n=1 Tax=Oncorhynchus mykiss TaxID=8022 RepID=A0A8C7LIR5_ONCMY